MKLYLNIFYSLIICGLILSCSKSDPIVTSDLNRSASVENLYKHSKEFTQNVYSHKNGIHSAVGFGIANSFLIEGEGTNIIIDATDSVYQAKKVYSKFQAINDNPISAIIYTHNHGDHTFGARYFVDQQSEPPLVIAHSTTAEAVEKIVGI